MPNLSTFPSQIDVFQERQEIHASDVPLITEYQTLMAKTRTTDEETRFQDLQKQLRDKIQMAQDTNHMQDSIVNLEGFFLNGTVGYMNEKQTEFNNEINKFTYKGVFNPSTQYYAKNYVSYNDGTGDNIYISLKDTIGNDPTNNIYWRKLGIKGEKGNDGIGLVFKAEWNNTITYNANDCVQYGGIIFGALKTNIGQQPDLTRDTEYWAKAWDTETVITINRGIRNITTSVNKINFMCGQITAFNRNTDFLEVYIDTTAPAENDDYIINNDNQTITKINGYWDGTTAKPIRFEFRVTRNMLNNLIFSDGQSIANQTITKNKFSQDIQDSINKVGAVTLTTTAQDLSSAINELDNQLGDVATLNTIDKSNVVKSINENTNKISVLNTNITNTTSSMNTHISDTSAHVKKDGTLQNGLNSSMLNYHTAIATPATNEKTDIIGMVNEAFTYANNGKTSIANVIGSPSVATETFAQLSNDIQTAKNTLASNLTNKGQSSSGTETLMGLIGKVASVNTGKRFASGTATTINAYSGARTVRGLSFRPTIIIGYQTINGYSVGTYWEGKINLCHLDYSTGSQTTLYNIYNDGFDMWVGGTDFTYIAFE